MFILFYTDGDVKDIVKMKTHPYQKGGVGK
jgi:hypothetical protein